MRIQRPPPPRPRVPTVGAAGSAGFDRAYAAAERAKDAKAMASAR